MTKGPTSTTESFLVSRLAARARRDDIAAPWEPNSFHALLHSYLSPDCIDQIKAAYQYAKDAHASQRRQTGHPYITHPLAVAATLAELHMDHQTLMAALLHDVIEDTATVKKALGARFGGPVAELVDGVSKLATIFNSHAEAQAVNMEKMILAMAKDIRVIIVKIADRLHNMRTIGVLTREQRQRIARETLDYYAPIAYRLGMHKINVELEDLGFEALYPLRAEAIRRAVKNARCGHEDLMDEIQQSLQGALEGEGISAKVGSREKHLYSIYQKMKNQNKPFKEIMDVFGFRIIVPDGDSCYRALGLVHNLYKPVSGRFKDYIAAPKRNGYQSLHTTLFGTHGVPFEVQIRTVAMAEVADHGVAGHWRLYKAPDEKTLGSRHTRRWVKDVVELQQRSGNPQEFIESLKSDLFPDNVYVFTPQGDAVELPRGACPVDFAYAVHTDIGNHCIACKIDRTLAPLSQQLESGQSVEIFTGEAAAPSPDWLGFAVSGKARACIVQSLKKRQRSESIALGRALLERSLANADSSINALDFRRLRRVFKEFGVRKLDEVLESIGTGEIMSYAVAQRFLAADNPSFQAVPIEHEGPIAISDGEGLVITWGHCCGPVPGDRIVGHMTPGKGLVVHTGACKNLIYVRHRYPQRIIPARWTEASDGEFLTPLRIGVDRSRGIIAGLATAVAEAEAEVEQVNVTDRTANTSWVSMVVGVDNRDHLARVMRRLRRVKGCSTMVRGGA